MALIIVVTKCSSSALLEKEIHFSYFQILLDLYLHLEMVC